MSEKDNIQLVRMLFDNLNAHNLESSRSLFDDDFQGTFPGAPSIQNREQAEMATQAYINAFPNLHFEVRDIIAQENIVAVTWVATGTNSGTMLTPTGGMMEPTHKTASTAGTTVIEIRNGKVVRQEVYFDLVGLLTQLGVMQPMQGGM